MSGSTGTETESPLWDLDISSTFKRGYKLKDQVNQRRIDNLIAELLHDENPQRFGIPKVTPDGPVLVADIGRKYRFAFRVNRDERKLDLVRVCDHKSVYGHD